MSDEELHEQLNEYQAKAFFKDRKFRTKHEMLKAISRNKNDVFQVNFPLGRLYKENFAG